MFCHYIQSDFEAVWNTHVYAEIYFNFQENYRVLSYMLGINNIGGQLKIPKFQAINNASILFSKSCKWQRPQGQPLIIRNGIDYQTATGELYTSWNLFCGRGNGLVITRNENDYKSTGRIANHALLGWKLREKTMYILMKKHTLKEKKERSLTCFLGIA